MKIKVLEKDVQKTILDYLAVKKIFHYRNNSGAFISHYKGKERFMRFGAKGSTDIICVIDGKFIGIECKGTGGKQNDNQIAFQQDLEKAGGKYILAFDLETVIEKL